jgi:hypothetical protein
MSRAHELTPIHSKSSSFRYSQIEKDPEDLNFHGAKPKYHILNLSALVLSALCLFGSFVFLSSEQPRESSAWSGKEYLVAVFH